ncbi:MAG: hypothetical protein FWD71_07180 [Oscillospiraceae bacterium]|nr:hypothetical protein [Oscillospiraceae bacterium]
MFGFFKNIIHKISNRIKKNDEENPEYRLKFARRICDKKIRYISERIIDGKTGEVVDTIIGKDGFFNINKNNELSIYLSGDKGGKELFRAFIPDLKASEFLSLEGVVLESLDLITNKERQIIAYYKYYR